MGLIKKQRKTAASGGGGDVPLEDKPFTQWTPQDIEQWSELCILDYIALLRDDEMEATELLDYTNNWQWEIIGEALVFKRVNEHHPDYLRLRNRPGSVREDDVVGHCRVHALHSLSYRPAVKDQAMFYQRKVDLQKQLNAHLPHQGIPTVPRPAWMN